jgi:hypothetical protein
MPRGRRYFTGLVADQHELRGRRLPIRGAGWAATFRKSPRTAISPQGRELILYARTWLAAQRTLGLILAATRLVSGEPDLGGVDSDLIAFNENEPERHSDRVVAEKTWVGRWGIPGACRVAAAASRRRQWIYAVHKYAFSVNLYGAFMIDLDPSTGRHLGLSRLPQDHIVLAHAVVAVHSALEDLGLELRASRDRPSRINGAWNPIVRQDLEARLVTARVSLTERMHWTIRGRSTAVHEARRLQPSQRSPWSRGPYVRDGLVDIVDAIAYLDWLRDTIATHASKKLTPSLSPYDIVNVQHLVRQLLLQVMGFWRRPLML